MKRMSLLDPRRNRSRGPCHRPADRQQPAQVDSSIAPYAKSSGISGNLSSIGSDTLNNLMTFWAEGFQKQYPNVRIQIEGKGSSTAPPALISGTAQLGPMSRPMKAEEIDEFEKKYGYKPSVVRVAVDGLAVYVSKDNPIEKLTLQQVDAVFSKTRKRGGKDAKTWGDLGLTGDWAGSRSRSMAATRPRAPTATSKRSRSPRATTRRP